MTDPNDIPDERIPISDGVTRSIRLWRPAKSGTVPTVIRSPHGL